MADPYTEAVIQIAELGDEIDRLRAALEDVRARVQDIASRYNEHHFVVDTVAKLLCETIPAALAGTVSPKPSPNLGDIPQPAEASESLPASASPKIPESNDRADAARWRWLASRINWRDMTCTAGDLAWEERIWVHFDYRKVRPDEESVQEYVDRMLRAEGPPPPAPGCPEADIQKSSVRPRAGIDTPMHSQCYLHGCQKAAPPPPAPAKGATGCFACGGTGMIDDEPSQPCDCTAPPPAPATEGKP